MSFCGGSFCTCCRRASSASGTSGSSPTGGGRRCCRCASRSSGRRVTQRPSPTPRQRMRHGRYGFAHSAAAPWRLWSDLPPPRHGSALPRRNASDYDLLFLISTLASAGPPAREDCPPVIRSHCQASRHSLSTSFCLQDPSFSAYLTLSRDQQRDSKRITPQGQTGSLQVALSKTLRRSDFASCSKLIAPERFRYSPRTSRPLAPAAAQNGHPRGRRVRFAGCDIFELG